jgi:hypothetical protein
VGNYTRLIMTYGFLKDIDERIPEEHPFRDFRNFAAYVWQTGLALPEPALIQYDICNYMQNLPVGKDGVARGQIQALRGAGKTYLAATFALWCLYLNPNIAIMVCSSVHRRAEEFVGLCRQIIDACPALSHMAPRTRWDSVSGKDQTDNMTCFTVGTRTRPRKEHSIQSFAILSAFTGVHPDVILADDIEIPENSLTAKKREKLRSKVAEFGDLIQPGGAIIIQGTPQTEESIYNSLAGSYPLRKWPARVPDPANPTASENVSPAILEAVLAGETKPGDPTYPERFGEDALIARVGEYGAARFALQMLLDTNLSDVDRYPLKLRNLIVMDVDSKQAPTNVVWGTLKPIPELEPQGMAGDYYYAPAYVAPEFAPYQTGVLWVDPAGGGGDEISYAVVKSLNGVLYALEVGGLAGRGARNQQMEMAFEELAKAAARHGIKKVVVEKNFGGPMFGMLLQPVMARLNGPTEITEIHSTGQKELRILGVLEPVLGAHRLVVTPEVAQDDKLMYQLTRLTRDRGSLVEDDRIEALAGACAQLADLSRLDPAKREESHKDALQAELVRDFNKALKGGRAELTQLPGTTQLPSKPKRFGNVTLGRWMGRR